MIILFAHIVIERTSSLIRDVTEYIEEIKKKKDCHLL